MEELQLDAIRKQTKDVLRELMEKADLKQGQILVVGCSSSEIGSFKIGSHSSGEIGQAVYEALYEELKPAGIYLAAQCCEHLNRALILEEEAALKYGYEPVNVVPQLKSRRLLCYGGLSYPGASGGSGAYPSSCGNRYRRYPDRDAFKGCGSSSADFKQRNWRRPCSLCQNTP